MDISPEGTPESFTYDNLLDALHCPAPLADKLTRVHQYLCVTHPFVDRIALATYDAQSGYLHTFVHSSATPSPLRFYQSPLSDSVSLSEIARERRPRVVNDIDAAYRAPREHAAALRKHGFGASFTMPIFHNGALYGFLFINSRRKHVFTEKVVRDLNTVGHLLALMMVSELSVIHTLTASVRTVTHIVQSRDFETGTHLERMAHYARLIARHVAPHYGLDDVFLEYLYLFAPLHDIGKVAVPDKLLLKPGRLTPEEFRVMQRHTTKGAEILDAMLGHFGLSNFEHAAMLRNIALFHHEAMNGSGYPHGLRGEQIPVEARIATVADVFDALSSRRPYKEAYDNERSLGILAELAGAKFDPLCVDALLAHRDEIGEIQQRFAADDLG